MKRLIENGQTFANFVAVSPTIVERHNPALKHLAGKSCEAAIAALVRDMGRMDKTKRRHTEGRKP